MPRIKRQKILERSTEVEDHVRHAELERIAFAVAENLLHAAAELRISVDQLREKNRLLLSAIENRLEAMPERDRQARLLGLHTDLERLFALYHTHLTQPGTPSALAHPFAQDSSAAESLQPIADSLFA